MGQCYSFTSFQNTPLYPFPRGNKEENPSVNDSVFIVQENPSSEIESSLPKVVDEPVITMVSVESVSSMDAIVDSDSSSSV